MEKDDFNCWLIKGEKNIEYIVILGIIFFIVFQLQFISGRVFELQ